MLSGPRPVLRAWLKIRQNPRVAPLLYAALHLIVYVLDMQVASAMLAELTLPDIWTGWLALIALAITALGDGDVTCSAGAKSGWQSMAKLNKQAWLQEWMILKSQVEGDCYEVYIRTKQG